MIPGTRKKTPCTKLSLYFWLVDPIRDEAVERKNEAEVELARCRIESMQVRRLWDGDDNDGGGDDDGGGGGDGDGDGGGGDDGDGGVISNLSTIVVFMAKTVIELGMKNASSLVFIGL